MSLVVKRIDSNFAHEICGIDLTADLSAETIDEIDAVFVKHAVVAIRDQKLTPEQHKAFARRFGDIEAHLAQKSTLPGHPEILVVSNIIENGRNIGVADAGLTWHSDSAYKAVTAKYSMLYALEVPVIDGLARGDTSFADCFAAYDALPESRKRELAGLQAIYRYGDHFEKRRQHGNPGALTDEQKQKTPDVLHPIVRTHPASKRKSIYVSEGLAVGVEGMPEAEGKALLQELVDHCTRPEFIYRHSWRVGDLVVWDNRSSLHRANLTDYALPYRRRMQRVTVTGTVPV